MRCNPFEFHTPPGWNPIGTAPRDGTVIEIQNNYGIAPWFSLSVWDEKWRTGGGWRDANNPNSGQGDTDALHLSWRPYQGGTKDYRDPSGGAQNTRAYWLRASGMNPRDYPGSELSFEQEARMHAPKEPKKRGFFARLFG